MTTAAPTSYLGKQFLLLSEELLLWDAKVLQPGAGLPPLQGHCLALLQHVLHLRYVRRESKTLQCWSCCLQESKAKCHFRWLQSSHAGREEVEECGGTGWVLPLMTCSGDMVFLSDLLQISLASDEMRWMNSVQQLTTSSRASLATRTLGRVSLIILLIAALGMVRSSSFPEEEAIVAGI